MRDIHEFDFHDLRCVVLTKIDPRIEMSFHVWLGTLILKGFTLPVASIIELLLLSTHDLIHKHNTTPVFLSGAHETLYLRVEVTFNNFR